MKKIFICSPYAGNIGRNVKIAQALCRLAIKAGYAPFAPHLLYPGLVDDSIEEERAAGISRGLAFMEVCAEVWVYAANGLSRGMLQEINQALKLGKPITILNDYTVISKGY